MVFSFSEEQRIHTSFKFHTSSTVLNTYDSKLSRCQVPLDLTFIFRLKFYDCYGTFRCSIIWEATLPLNIICR